MLPRSSLVRQATASLRRVRRLTTASTGSVNAAEIEHFSRLSSAWWDEHGEFGLLHRMNPVRMRFVRDKIREIQLEENEKLEDGPLRGLEVLDVGCGGGLLSESLARLGAKTTGIDASGSNIAIASLHSSNDPALQSGGLTYLHTSAETLLQDSKRYDVVCSMEVVEHVDNPSQFLSTLCDLVKPGGHLFLSTIARTPLSYLLTIFAAEQLLRLVTPGTHTYSKYINASELLTFFERQNWITRLHGGTPTRTEAEVRGLMYIPWKGEWILSGRDAPNPLTTSCNYMLWVRKPKSISSS